MAGTGDVFDSEILTKLTPRASQLVEEIYNSLSALEVDENELIDLAWKDVYDSFSRDTFRIANVVANNIGKNYLDVVQILTEYDFDLYQDSMNKSLEELVSNPEDFLKIKISNKQTSKPITLSLDRERLFGRPESYIATAKRLRRSKESPEKRSKKWKNLYKAAREGEREVSMEILLSDYYGGKRRKGKKEKARDSAITKYRRIVARRLDAFQKPGFWYFIEHGNVGLKGVEGTPYPVYSGPPFPFIKIAVRKAEEFINKDFLDRYRKARSLYRVEKNKELKALLDEFIEALAKGFELQDKNLIRSAIRLGDDLKRRLVLTKSKRYGIRIGVRRL